VELSHVAQSCYSVIGDKPILWSKPKFDSNYNSMTYAALWPSGCRRHGSMPAGLRCDFVSFGFDCSLKSVVFS